MSNWLLWFMCIMQPILLFTAEKKETKFCIEFISWLEFMWGNLESISPLWSWINSLIGILPDSLESIDSFWLIFIPLFFEWLVLLIFVQNFFKLIHQVLWCYYLLFQLLVISVVCYLIIIWKYYFYFTFMLRENSKNNFF